MKAYTTKSNATRAIKSFVASFELEGETFPQLEVIELDNGFGVKAIFDSKNYVENPLSSEALNRGFATASINTTPIVEAAPAALRRNYYLHEVSDHGGVCRNVWAIADSMPGAKRKDVIEACRAAGIAFGTARTQYQKWRKRG
jgi:hypothetical protein